MNKEKVEEALKQVRPALQRDGGDVVHAALAVGDRNDPRDHRRIFPKRQSKRDRRPSARRSVAHNSSTLRRTRDRKRRKRRYAAETTPCGGSGVAKAPA